MTIAFFATYTFAGLMTGIREAKKAVKIDCMDEVAVAVALIIPFLFWPIVLL